MIFGTDSEMVPTQLLTVSATSPTPHDRATSDHAGTDVNVDVISDVTTDVVTHVGADVLDLTVHGGCPHFR